MGHHERRERPDFLTHEETKVLFLYEYEAEFSKNCATEFDKRLKYVFEAPEILEKAWKMPWRDGWKEDLKPVLTIYGDPFGYFGRKFKDRGAKWNLRNKPFDKKDWGDFE